jgi:hypothetical protein
MERVRIYPGVVKSIIDWLFLVPIMAYVGWQYWRAFAFLPVFVWLVAVLPFLLLLPSAVHRLAMTLHLFPAAVVSEEGIYDRSTLHGARMIPWSSVANVEVCSLLMSPTVGITLKGRKSRVLRQCLPEKISCHTQSQNGKP